MYIHYVKVCCSSPAKLWLRFELILAPALASKINVTPKGIRLSEKLQLTAALCNEI